MQKKLAIIGGGIAGVTAAYLLQEKYAVTLFEKNDYLGGNNHSVELEKNQFGPTAVIIFPRKKVFVNTHYFAKKFKLLLKRKTLPHVFMHNQSLRYYSSHHVIRPHELSFSQIWRETRNLLYLIFKFSKDKYYFNKTIQYLIRDKKLSENCVRYFLFPFAALYLSMPYHELFELPIFIIAEWWHKYSSPIYAMSMYSYIEGGNHLLVDEFIKHSNITIKSNHEVLNVKRHEQGVNLTCQDTVETFDKVIFATWPDEVLKILAEPSVTERKILNGIDMGTMVSTLHTDASHCYQGAMTLDVCDKYRNTPTLVTTWEEGFCFDLPLRKKYYISIHEENYHVIPSECIIQQQILRIPLATEKTMQTLNQINMLNRAGAPVYFCGSYFNPFFYHEDAITSAMQVSQLFT